MSAKARGEHVSFERESVKTCEKDNFSDSDFHIYFNCLSVPHSASRSGIGEGDLHQKKMHAI
jgi:hypothetical protein